MGVSNATSALHLTLLSLGIGKDDEVILPTLTFAATQNSVTYCGATPVLADIDPDTFNISINSIKKKITTKTKAIIVVHYGGQACDMDKIISLAKKHNLFIIEDCAHALGSKFGNKFCGNIGIAGCFSFYPTKIITTAEGGMVSTNNLQQSQQIKLLRSQGLSINPVLREKYGSGKYDIVTLGFNYRLDEIRSSLGISQLCRVNTINNLRIKIAKKYDEYLSKIPGIHIPHVAKNRNHIYHLYTIKITDEYHLSRDELIKKLFSARIGFSIQYTPLHDMTYNLKKFISKDFPNANKIKNQILCLPIFPKMTIKQIHYVLSTLK
jgi:dTDP-4-amino-4,6-dideoxygalactose transaminase